MVSQHIKEFLAQLNTALITDVFVYALLALFVLAFVLRLLRRGQNFNDQAPTLLTTLGILGTFTGIIVGLLEFQVNAIDSSIGALLDGLKMAFVTSVVGMSLAFIYRIFANIWNPFAPAQKETTAKELLDILVLQHHALTQVQRSITDRNEQADAFQDRLLSQLTSFTQQLAETTTKEIVGALQSVVDQYNEHIKSQFGENFAKLDSGIGALLEWQEKNRDQMTVLMASIGQGADSMQAIDAALEGVTEKLAGYPELMSNLDVVLDQNQNQVAQLAEQLKVYRDIGESAAKAIPEFGETLEQTKSQIGEISQLIAEQIGSSVTEIDDVLTKGASHLTSNIQYLSELASNSGTGIQQVSESLRDQIEQSFNVMAAHFKHSIRSLSEVSEKLAQEIGMLSTDFQSIARFDQSQVQVVIERSEQMFVASMEELVKQQQAHGEYLVDKVEGAITQHLQRGDHSLEQQLSRIEKVMGEEIEQVLQSMGGALAAISGQFTSDYQLLINQMKRIVETPVKVDAPTRAETPVKVETPVEEMA